MAAGFVTLSIEIPEVQLPEYVRALCNSPFAPPGPASAGKARQTLINYAKNLLLEEKRVTARAEAEEAVIVAEGIK